MSCKHGNWEPCEDCEEEDRRDKLAYERGFADGVTAATQKYPNATDDRRWRIDVGGYVLRGVTMWHFCEANGYTTTDRCTIGNMRDGETVRIGSRAITRGDRWVSNAKSQATDAALSRQVACTDGLCIGDNNG